MSGYDQRGAKSKRSNATVDLVNRRVIEALASVGERNVLAAFSGGADSTCVLQALLSTAQESVQACFVQHGLRPEDSAEREHVENVCRRLGVDIHVRSVDTKALMQGDGLSMEVAARRLRYDALRKVAAETGATHIVLGHTSDDQVETVLMHEFRGAGLSGLAGMRALRGDLFRPLLTTSHAETVEYCRELGLDFLEDESNSDVSIPRNALRHNVLPDIEGLYPGARGAVLRLAATAGRDIEYLETLAQEGIIYVAPDGVLIPAVWAALPWSLRLHVLRLLASGRGDVSGSEELEAWASRLLDVCRKPTPAEVTDLVVFAEEQTSPMSLRSPSVCQISGMQFETSVQAVDVVLRQKVLLAMPNQAYMDADRLPGGLTVRSWRPGDRIRPLGMRGSKKVQDVFVDRRVPRQTRRRVPVVESGGRIVWIPGIALSLDASIQAETIRVVNVMVRPAGPAGQ